MRTLAIAFALLLTAFAVSLISGKDIALPERWQNGAAEASSARQGGHGAYYEGTESGAQSKFLASAFDANQEQICDIGANDQQHEADRRHHNPQDAAHVTDDILLERTDVG